MRIRWAQAGLVAAGLILSVGAGAARAQDAAVVNAKTIKVKLSGPAKQAVVKKPLKAKVSGSGIRASTVKLKPAKKKC